MKKSLFALSILILFSTQGCIYQNLSTSKIDTVISSTVKEKNPILEILVEQKRNNGEIISIGSKAIKSVLIDDVDYPINKLVINEFKVEIPDLASGKHKLSVNLYFQNSGFNAPIIIPNVKTDKLFLLLRANIDEKTGNIIKLEYGFDFDRNGAIDNNIEKFEGNGKDFVVISKEGIRKKIDLNLNTSTTLPEEKLPSGILPNNQSKIEVSLPQSQTIEIPKPQILSDGLYPLPPSINKNTEPTLQKNIPVPSATPRDIEIEEIQ